VVDVACLGLAVPWLLFFCLLSPGLYWCPIWHLHSSRKTAGGKQHFPSLPRYIPLSSQQSSRAELAASSAVVASQERCVLKKEILYAEKKLQHGEAPSKCSVSL